MPQFAHIEHLNWLWLVVAGAIILFIYIRWRKNALNSLSSEVNRKVILPRFSNSRSIIFAVLLLSCIFFLVVTLANLQIGKQPQKAQRAGLDLVVALDISKSMDAQDLKPSRMAQAKHFVQQLMQRLPQDRVGLVVFAGNAYIQMPLTTDLGATEMFVSSINTNMAPTQGTAVAAAITQSMALLFPEKKTASDQSAKVIVLISDGENHEPGTTEAAEEAEKSGAIIYTVGAGSTQGAPIPINENGYSGLQKDEHGETVITKLNESVLQEIATQTNGKYISLARDKNAVSTIISELAKLKRGEKEVRIFGVYESYFQWFAGIALILLLIEPFFIILRKQAR